MKIKIFSILLSVGVNHSLCQAEEVKAEVTFEGNVKVLGNKINRRVVLKEGPNKFKVCRKSEHWKSLQKLAEMKVQVEGFEKKRKKKRKSCLMVQNFSLTETSTGKRALVGTLLKQENQFSLKVSDNKQVAIKSVLPGMEELVGSRVVLSIDKGLNLTDSQSINIHSYISYPEQSEQGAKQ